MGRVHEVARDSQATGVLVAVVAGAATVWSPKAALFMAAAVLLVLVSPLLQRIARGASWSLPLIVTIFLILVDFSSLAASPGLTRYVPPAIVLAVVLAMKTRGARAGRAMRISMGAFCAYGLIGTVYGRFWSGTQDGAFPVVLPMLISLMGWARQEGDDDADLRIALRLIAFFGSIYALGCAVVRLAALSEELAVFSHEKAFLMTLAVASAVAARSRWLTVLSIASVVTAFATYPAATYVVAVFAALLTVVLLGLSPGRPTRTVLGLSGMAAVLWAVLHVDELITFTAPYFALVGKTDNGSTRVALYENALRQLAGDPVFARFFSGDLTVTTRLDGQSGVVIPVHNDYLGVALSGGIVAAGLLLAAFMFANGGAVSAVRACGMTSTRGRAITALLASLNTAAITAFANPVLMNPGSSLAVYAIIFALVSLCVGAQVTAPPRKPEAALGLGPAPSKHLGSTRR